MIGEDHRAFVLPVESKWNQLTGISATLWSDQEVGHDCGIMIGDNHKAVVLPVESKWNQLTGISATLRSD
jgi:hypothetical protein